MLNGFHGCIGSPERGLDNARGRTRGSCRGALVLRSFCVFLMSSAFPHLLRLRNNILQRLKGNKVQRYKDKQVQRKRKRTEGGGRARDVVTATAPSQPFDTLEGKQAIHRYARFVKKFQASFRSPVCFLGCRQDVIRRQRQEIYTPDRQGTCYLF